MAGNRAVTLTGANEIFKPLDIVIEQHEELGFYQAQYKGQTIQAKTLTKTCQLLVEAIATRAR